MVRTLMGCAATAAVIGFLSVGPSQAAMAPVVQYGHPAIQNVDCAVGMHMGPAGVCVVGVEERHDDKVIEHRSADEDCKTKSVTKENAEGDTKTKTMTKCD